MIEKIEIEKIKPFKKISNYKTSFLNYINYLTKYHYSNSNNYKKLLKNFNYNKNNIYNLEDLPFISNNHFKIAILK